MRVAGAVLLWAACAAANGVEIQSADFAGRWLVPSAELRIKFARLLEPNEGTLAFVDGSSDLTPFFRQLGPGEFVYSGRQLPLQPGQRQLKVFLVKDGEWKELNSFELKVTTDTGFERFDAKPRLDATMKGQLDQGRRGAAPQFTRPDQYQDGTLQGGLALEAERAGLKLASRANIVGSTYQPEVLRFSQLGNHAPRADLSDYLVDMQWGQSQFSAGHISYGNNPLLLMGYGSRGLGYRQQLTERVDFSLNAMNGTSIAGAHNVLGLDDAEHQVRGGMVGVELLERKGGLRAEVQHLDSTLKSLVPLNTGAVPDAEKIRGTGLRILGSDPSGRFRGDLALARVKHTAVADPTLSQGQSLTEIKPVTKGARALDLAYDLVKPGGNGAKLPFGLTATFRHERIDPLFKAVGIGFAADQEFQRWGLNALWGPMQAQAYVSRRQDNLQNIPTLLKTRTDVEALSLALPLSQLWPGESAPRDWLPTLGYRHETNHQRAINVPIAALSAFNATHLPDQLNRVHSFTAGWNAPDWQLSYTFNLATQDNRQIGRDTADFHNTSHAVQGAYRFSQTFNMTLGVGRTANYANERTLMNYTHSYAAGFDWQFLDRWSLTGNYTFNTGDDSQKLVDTRGQTAQTQLAWRFTVPSFGMERPLPGQLFVRHIVTGNYNRDNVFGLLDAGRFWMLQTGVTVSFF